MTIEQDFNLKPQISREFLATGIIAANNFDTTMCGNLRVVVENVGGGNVMVVEGRIQGQTAFQPLATITGLTSGTTVDISLVDEIRFNCTTYSASGGTPKLLASGFFKKGGGGGAANTFETINTPLGTDPVASGVSTLNLTSADGTNKITGTAGTNTVDWSQPASSAIAASAIDWNLGNLHSKTLAANTTFTFSNAADGRTITVILTNTASNFTVTWPAGIKWPAGSAPVQTIGAKIDVYTFVQYGSIIVGTAMQNLS